MREIAVIVVSWRDADDLAELVASLAAARRAVAADGPRVTLTIVVNGGHGSIREEPLRALWPDAAILHNDANRGFGPAANQGAATTPADAFLFVNPDARAIGDPFTAIARGFEANPGAVAIAPRLLPNDGPAAAPAGPLRLAPPGNEDQSTFQLRRLPALSSDARELLLLDHLVPNNRGRRRERYADRDREKPFAVEQAAAAALAVRGDAFRRIGGFDERFVPAWFEDVDLCARLAAEGTVLYWPDARFRHRGGASADRLGYARFLPIYYANALRYRRRHYGFAARAAYRLLLVAGMLLRIAALPVRRSDPRPKSESLRAYLRVLQMLFGSRAVSSP